MCDACQAAVVSLCHKVCGLLGKKINRFVGRHGRKILVYVGQLLSVTPVVSGNQSLASAGRHSHVWCMSISFCAFRPLYRERKAHSFSQQAWSRSLSACWAPVEHN